MHGTITLVVIKDQEHQSTEDHGVTKAWYDIFIMCLLGSSNFVIFLSYLNLRAMSKILKRQRWMEGMTNVHLEYSVQNKTGISYGLRKSTY